MAFAPLAYNLVTQIVIDKSIEKWKIPNQITTVSIDKIGTLNFADDLYLIGKPNEEHNQRLQDLHNWLTEMKMKINAQKSLSTILPIKKHLNFVTKINQTTIPRVNNQRTLGNYLTEDKIFKDEIERRKIKIIQSLNLLPAAIIEPKNLKNIIMGKSISNFIHIARGNVIEEPLINKIDTAIRQSIRKALQIEKRTGLHCFYLPLEQGGLGIPTLKYITKKILINTMLNQLQSNNILIQKITKQALQRASTKKKKNPNIYQQTKKILTECNLHLTYANTTHQFPTPTIHNNQQKYKISTDGSKSETGTGYGIAIQSEMATTRHKFKLDEQ